MAKKKIPDQHVKLIAENLLPSFIPKAPEETELTFHFTAEGVNYQVKFNKEGKNWVFDSFKEQTEE